jgi:integrase
MKKNARADITINTTVRRLKTLAKKCDINDPEQVKTVLATETNWQNSTKENIANSYTNYLTFLGKTWKKPKYKRQSKIPYIPTEQELDALINASRKRMATFLQFLKETGARSGEATNLQWIDIDPQRKMVYIRAEKNSNDRLLPVSEQLLAMLNQLPKTSERVFKSQVKSMRKTFEKIRNRTAVTLANPKLKEIHFHTFRHWKATTKMHECHDAWEVKQILGHKTIKSTEIYIHIDQMTSNYSKQWSSLVTHSIEEETNAINTGFELVRAINETTAIYRKRK